MAAELRITLGGANKRVGSITLHRISAGMRGNLRKGLAKGGAIIARQIKEHLSGPGYSRDSGRSKPYPGIGRYPGGTLRSSVNFQLEPDGMTVHIGPGGAASAYAAIHETGGTITQTVTRRQQRYLAAAKGIFVRVGSTLRIQIPARPYVVPAWDKKGKEVVRAIARMVTRGR